MSTYPPTRCGIATFTRSLITSMAESRGVVEGLAVARIRGRDDETISGVPEVAVEVTVDDPSWPVEVARAGLGFDVIWIQHEFGIYGADSGRKLLELCDAASRPLITTLHTVLVDPTPVQREIVERLATRSESLVVMSRAARERLLTTHAVDPEKVRVVPHGAPEFRRAEVRDPGARPTIGTWGLFGPGKGLEWGIRALPYLRHLRPLPRYLIRGATHPNVLLVNGEAYRESLLGLASDLGVTDMLTMSSDYLTDEQMATMLAEVDIVLLPYDSTVQVTSGVLVEALAAGLPVVATAFPHAIELLSGGAGRVIPHRDPRAMAAALEELLTSPEALRAACTAADGIAPDLSWSSVAKRCEHVADEAAAGLGSRHVGATTPLSDLPRRGITKPRAVIRGM